MAIKQLNELSQITLLGTKGISDHFKPSGELISILRAKNYNEKSLYNLQNCGNQSGRFILAQCKCQAHVLSIKTHCDLSVCPTCNKRRSERIFNKYSQVLAQVPKENGYKFSFLTFSPQNFPSLKEGLISIRKSWKRFLKLKHTKQRIKGGIYVIEAKNPSGTWNLHIHAIIYTKWLDNRVREGEKDSLLVKLFQKASRSRVNIDIRRVGGGKRGILAYMLKYISHNKNDFYDTQSHAEFIIHMHKTRLITTFGKGFYKAIIKKPVMPCCPECDSPYSFSIIEYEVQELIEISLRKNKPKGIYTWIS